MSINEESFLKRKVREHLKAFKTSDFCPDGGWPNFDHMEVLVLHQAVEAEFVVYDIEMTYVCESPGCCFIPGSEAYASLRKKVKLGKTSFEVLP